jgi:hypothetical protein
MIRELLALLYYVGLVAWAIVVASAMEAWREKP